MLSPQIWYNPSVVTVGVCGGVLGFMSHSLEFATFILSGWGLKKIRPSWSHCLYIFQSPLLLCGMFQLSDLFQSNFSQRDETLSKILNFCKFLQTRQLGRKGKLLPNWWVWTVAITVQMREKLSQKHRRFNRKAQTPQKWVFLSWGTDGSRWLLSPTCL